MSQNDKIQKMIMFIKNEADEQAKMDRVSADEQFTIEKARLVESQRKKTKEIYKRKLDQVKIQKQIEDSNEKKKVRLELLKMRQETLDVLAEEGLKKLKEKITNKSEYKPMLKDLILQGLIIVDEKKAYITLKKGDVELAKSLEGDLKSEYKEKTEKDVELVFTDDNLDEKVTGGAIVCGLGDRIRVNNTFDERMKICVQRKVPEIRNILFPKSDL